MISPTWNCILPKSSNVISGFASISITSSSETSSFSSTCGCSSSTLFITSLMSCLANRISGLSVTFPSPNCAKIFSAVSGMKDESNPAPTLILSIRFARTVSRRSFLSSSFASAQGIVSSMYLLQRLKSVKISVIASATRKSFIFTSTFFGVFSVTAFRSASIAAPSSSNVTFLFVTTPPKYLFVMEIVLFTRFPNVFARSELIRSTSRSQEMTPSFSNGISCSTK